MALNDEPWNLSTITAPPACTVKTVVKHSEIKGMKETLFSAATTLKDLQVMKTEDDILSMFLYKFKRIFRQDKGIQLLSKVKQAMKRSSQYNMLEAIQKLNGCFPYKIPPNGREAHLPTQQMLKWVLLRLLANAKIFMRMMELCIHAGKYIYHRLYIGWSARYMLFALGVNSRILACAKFLLINIIEWYDQLRMYLPYLRETVEFVKGYEFPKKMEDFIGHVNLKPPTHKVSIDRIFELIDLTRGEECGDEDIILLNEIIDVTDLASDAEANDDVIIEEERISKMKKRVADGDVSVLYESLNESKKQKKSSQNPLKKPKFVEDLGESIPRNKKFKNKRRKRNLGKSR